MGKIAYVKLAGQVKIVTYVQQDGLVKIVINVSQDIMGKIVEVLNTGGPRIARIRIVRLHYSAVNFLFPKDSILK